MSMSDLDASHARALAEEAYVYGFAMVENYKAIFGMCVCEDSPQYSGFNRYLHGRTLFDADYDLVVSANNDTLYSTTFADLRREPVVISVPPTGARYFVIQLVDMGTDNFAYVGTRTTGRDGGDFVLVGPTFKGALPAERFDRVIVSPSQFAALATRTALDGADDLDGVIAVQDALQVRPLSQFLGTPAPAPPPEVAFPPFSTNVYGSPRLFELLNFLLRWHTPPLFEMELHQRLRRIGIGANRTFSLDGLAPDVKNAIEAGCANAHAKIEQRGNALGTTIDGWEVSPPMGAFGDDYLLRAAVAWKFIYTNSPEEALYPIANLDADGDPLTGSRDYVLHFPAGELPPVEAFWSITMYHADSRLMVHNPIDRYSIGDRTKGLLYDDGSLTIAIQHEAPSGRLAANWLPAPAGDFYLIARTYIPRQAMLDGSYKLPAIQKA